MPSQTRRCKSVLNKTRKIRYDLDLTKDTRVLVLYIADTPRYFSPRWTTESILSDASGYLGDEHYMYGLELKCKADKEKLQKISMEQLRSLIQKALTTKYRSRPSPSFSAAPLCGYTLSGNDGRLYKSVKSGTSCTWRPV